MGVATARTAPATTGTANAGVVLLLSLSPSSKAIAKQGSGKPRLLAADGASSFQCRTCGRRFATFQALGGHRTSHKRPRVRAAGLDLLLGARPGKGAAVTAHRCHACGEVFPTGQALGGHMRRHRAAAASDVAVPEMSTTSEDLDGGHLLPGITLFQFI